MRPCRRVLDCPVCGTESVLADVTLLLVALEPTVDRETASATAALVAPSTGERRRLLAWLREHPDGLRSSDSTCPPVAVRLIVELRRHGLLVAAPRCLDCGRERPLPAAVAGGRVCSQCYLQRRAEPCAGCGRARVVTTRAPDGLAVCASCRANDPSTWRRCGRCGQLAPPVVTEPGATIGRCCYVPPLLRCTVCGVNKGRRPYTAGRLVCHVCVEYPSVTCSSCGLDALAPRGHNEHPLCARCRTTRQAPCSVCGTLTVGRARDGRPRCPTCYQRPVSACGRCGRVRPIVRLARDGDPDLCGVCWQGPVMPCAGCGRVRPCRGERQGRMLCPVCRPVRPQLCAHCGRPRPPTAHWPEGPVCMACYGRALAAKGTCPGCGQVRRLRQHPGFDQPLCATCAGQPTTHVCTRCGVEDLLYERGVCPRCVLKRRLAALFGDEATRRRAGLASFFDALVAAPEPRAALDWLRQGRTGMALLGRIARGEVALAYNALDDLESVFNVGPLRHLEHLLAATGALPTRDPVLASLERWCAQLLAGIHDAEHAHLLRSYVQWRLLRPLRTRRPHGALTESTGSSARTRLRGIATFLAWLSQQGRQLSTCEQRDLDAWCMRQPPYRLQTLHAFVGWAIAQNAMPPLRLPGRLELAPSPPIETDARWAIARHLLHAPAIDVADRVAGALVVIYAQPLTRISRLTIADLVVQPERLTVRLGASPVEVPEPLAGYARELLARRRPDPRKAKLLTDPGWLFLGAHPGRPIRFDALGTRLRRLGVRPGPHRRAALYQLAAELPAALVADLLGLSPTTANSWARLAGRSWNTYPALREEVKTCFAK